VALRGFPACDNTSVIYINGNESETEKSETETDKFGYPLRFFRDAVR